MERYAPGHVLLLERPVPGIPYSTGLFVLCGVLEGMATFALCGAGSEGLRPIDNYWTIDARDISAFSDTGERASTQAMPRPEAPMWSEEEEKGWAGEEKRK